jgi:hypothetical protein
MAWCTVGSSSIDKSYKKPDPVLTIVQLRVKLGPFGISREKIFSNSCGRDQRFSSPGHAQLNNSNSGYSLLTISLKKCHITHYSTES